MAESGGSGRHSASRCLGTPLAALPAPSAHPRRDTDAHSPDTHSRPLALGGELKQLWDSIRPGAGNEGGTRARAVRACVTHTHEEGISNKSEITIKSRGPSIRSTWLERRERILASFPLSFSPASELEGAKCSAGRATVSDGRSPRNDTLINVFFYLLSQGLAPVCKHSTAFAESRRSPLTTHVSLWRRRLEAGRAARSQGELPTRPGSSLRH